MTYLLGLLTSSFWSVSRTSGFGYPGRRRVHCREDACCCGSKCHHLMPHLQTIKVRPAPLLCTGTVWLLHPCMTSPRVSYTDAQSEKTCFPDHYCTHAKTLHVAYKTLCPTHTVRICVNKLFPYHLQWHLIGAAEAVALLTVLHGNSSLQQRNYHSFMTIMHVTIRPASLSVTLVACQGDTFRWCKQKMSDKQISCLKQNNVHNTTDIPAE